LFESSISVIAPLFKRFKGKGVGVVLFRGASGAFAINFIGIGIAFGIQLLLARVLGAKSYGDYTFAMTWMNLLAVASKLGFDTTSLRFVAEYNGTEKWALLLGFIRRTNQIVLISSIFAGAGLAGVVWLIQNRIESELAAALWVVCPLISLFVLLFIRVSILRALKHIIRAQSLLRIIRPGLFAGAIFFFIIFSEKG